RLVDDGQRQDVLAIVALAGETGVLGESLAMRRKPAQVRGECGVLLEVVYVEHVDREDRDHADLRPHAETVELTIGIAEGVVEEALALVPELKIAAANVLHGLADEGVM